jgi:hypothetical protein
MQRCPRCHRSNPAAAAFCHFDGAALGTAASDGRLPFEFVFPSGRRCRTYDELARGCQAEWDTARDLLQRGLFEQFLSNAGRLDLARAAQDAAAQPDRDLGLGSFVARLPATNLPLPRLDLDPRRLVVGPLRVGDQQQVQLRILNQGQGLLAGTLAVADGADWLRPTAGNGKCRLKTEREQRVRLTVATAGLTPQTYSARLTIITNGGIAEVPVRLDVTAQPFDVAPFQGAQSPRDLAQRLRDQPRAAVPLLESGAVGRWFAANGWLYPVAGPPAPGSAGLQQLLAAMGLAKAPVVQTVETAIEVACAPAEQLRQSITLRTPAKKWVYARAASDAPWLRVTTPAVSGPQKAVIELAMDSASLTAGRVHEAKVAIIANGGQKLTVPVRVEVRRPPVPPSRHWLRPVLAGALAGILLRLLLALPADLTARVLPAAGTAPAWSQPPDPPTLVRHVVLATAWLGVPAGVALLWRRGRWTDLAFAAIAGLFAAAIGSATVACLMPLLDAVPRAAWPAVAGLLDEMGLGQSTVAATGGWIGLAAVWWGLLGAGVGLGIAAVSERSPLR